MSGEPLSKVSAERPMGLLLYKTSKVTKHGCWKFLKSLPWELMLRRPCVL
jgi:hypothetical protein